MPSFSSLESSGAHNPNPRFRTKFNVFYFGMVDFWGRPPIARPRARSNRPASSREGHAPKPVCTHRGVACAQTVLLEKALSPEILAKSWAAMKCPDWVSEINARTSAIVQFQVAPVPLPASGSRPGKKKKRNVKFSVDSRLICFPGLCTPLQLQKRASARAGCAARRLAAGSMNDLLSGFPAFRRPSSASSPAEDDRICGEKKRELAASGTSGGG